ncbi:MAG: DoxX family protein [Wenyingzhuangia sp.]
MSNKSWGINLSMLLLRITLGLTMIYLHGLPKLNTLFSGTQIKFANPFGLGAMASLSLVVFAEVICSVLLVLGLLTRLSLLPLIFTMGVAVFIIHGGEGLRSQESAIIYLVGYLVLFLQGSGKYSLDRLLLRK